MINHIHINLGYNSSSASSLQRQLNYYVTARMKNYILENLYIVIIYSCPDIRYYVCNKMSQVGAIWFTLQMKLESLSLVFSQSKWTLKSTSL